MIKSQQSIAISVKYKLLLVLLSLIGAGIILIATSRYGAGISPDSVDYIATARHLADGIGFITYNNAPLLVQPPLYPAILGIIDFVFGIDPLTSANFISAVFFGLTLYLSGLLFLKNLSPSLALLGTASLLVSIPLITVSFMAWSEPPFVFFVALYLFALSMYLQKKNIKSFSLLSLSVALVCLTRYIGVVLVLTGIISILIIQHNSLKAKLLHAFTFAFVSILTISIWIGRNYILSKTLFGPRSPSLHSLSDNLRYTFDTILRWYLPSRIADSCPVLMLLSLVVGFLIGVIFVWAKTPITTLLKRTHPFFIFILLLIFGYTGFLIISSTTTNYDPIGDRLLSPIVIPTTLLLFLVIEILSKPIKEHFPTKPVELLLTATIALWLVYPARATVLNAIHQFNEGNGYSAKSWKNSQTIQYIRENNLSTCAIYSNGADVTYLLLNINIKSIPSKSSGANIIADTSSLQNVFPRENKVCIVWFNQITWRTYLFTPDEITSVTNLERVVQLNDGTIYVVSRK
jgi:hypothetical protein